MPEMPSGRTHDAITLLLAAPAAAAVYSVANNAMASLIVAGAFVFGGLMFGPDLDTVSRQYSRWSVFRFVWIPYRRFFRHRSRFSHGLLFGALIRVVYFLGVVSILAFGALYVYAAFRGARMPAPSDVSGLWENFGAWVRADLGEHFLLIGFLGLWLGAASHTLTDMAGSFIRTGRVGEFL
jgi:uncharacterized metal-binding protein